jgi:hypothetical protein
VYIARLGRNDQSKVHVTYVFCYTPINKLPDDVLLQIFDLYVNEDQRMEAWQLITVHVCRRWRNIVFGSPRHLKLQLYCNHNTPARDMLDIWPSLPLLVYNTEALDSTWDTDNIVAVLQHSDRVCQIGLFKVTSWQLGEVLPAMRLPFPELTSLHLQLETSETTVIPDSFLGGSASRLRSLTLDRVPFPGLPKLLLYTTHLINPRLHGIPHSGYFSPEAMVTALSTLTSLVEFEFGLQSPRSYPEQENRRPPPPTRSVLSALKFLSFRGVSEYLDGLVALIDTPKLVTLGISLFNQIDFDTPHLVQFIDRTPGLKAFDEARVVFDKRYAWVALQSSTSEGLRMGILCEELDWQLSSLAQFCTFYLTPLVTVESLYIICDWRYSDSQLDFPDRDDIENMLWQELLRPFTSVKSLYLSELFAPFIAPTLQNLDSGEMTQVLPTLQNIFLEALQPSEPDSGFSPTDPNPPVSFTPEQLGVLRAQIHAFKMCMRGLPVPAELQNLIRPPNSPNFEKLLPPAREAIKQLVAARRISGHPITVLIFVFDRGSLALSSIG